MKDMPEVVDSVIDNLQSVEDTREEVIRLTRKLNRQSGKGIAKLVRGKDFEEYLENARNIIGDLHLLMQGIEAITSWNITISGTEEYAELEILIAVLQGNTIPSPTEIHVPGYIWISGLGDVIGELRRIMLNAIIGNDMDAAKLTLDKIQSIFEQIVGVEFSKSLVPNLRRKIDVARTLVERCESDYANALLNKRTNT